MEHFKMFIAGKFCEAKSGKTMQALDPGTGQPVATVPCGGPADADKAVRAVRKAFDSGTWSGLSPEDRSAIIMDWADRIEMQVPRLAMYESMNSGALISSVGGSIWTAVRSMRNLAWYAATQFPWREEVPMSGGIVGFGRNVTIREPIGVCVGIVPWNMPIMMALWKISHAIAMGNTIVIKPASDTPLSALILGETIAESKIPKGVINIVTGPGGELGEALASHPDVDRISFTGSTEVGKRIMQLGGQTIKRMTMELGGKSANIVLEDADIDIAVDGAMTGIFYHSGQICIAGSRLLVARSIYDEFVKRLKKRVGDIGIGYQMMPETQMGPVASAKQLDKIKQYVAIGKKEGAKLLCGGERARLPGFEGGYYFKPTIFVNVENKMRIAQEEIFGPVLCVIPFKDDDEAVRIANDTAYGLAGAVWSRDIGRAEKLAVRIKTGTMWINDYSNMADFTPFGGYKQSGVGREFGHEGLAEYTEAKRIYVSPEGNPDRPNFQSILRYPRSGTFTFNGSTKINAGPGSVASASTEIFNLGCRRAVVITDKGIRNAGVLDIVAKAMGDYCVGVFDGVEPDTGYEIIDGAVAVCKEARADCLVALGGGSSIDTAKGAAVTLTNGGRAIDNISVFRLVKPVVPIIAIPTTHGTGSEVTNIAVVLNRDLKKKFFIVEQAITPRTAILDGALVVGLPKSVSIGTGMDALTHSLESAICRVNNSITSAFALQSIRLVARYLPMVADNGKDVEARQQMLNAATMGGWACFAGAGVAHSIAHTVGSLCHVHHGTACGIALPHAMRFNRDFCLPELGLVAEALGVKTGGKSQTQIADAAADAVADLLKRIGHPTKYRDVGVPEDAIGFVVMGTMTDGSNYSNPRPVLDPTAVTELVKACF